MFLLVPAHPGSPGQNPESHKTVVVVMAVAVAVAVVVIQAIISVKKHLTTILL